MQYSTLTPFMLALASLGLAAENFQGSACIAPSQPDRKVEAYPSIQTQWGQCGGKDYDGPTKCSNGWSCKKQNDWYSQCMEGPADIQALYGQCGGKDYEGPTKCAAPATCKKQDEYYSQCLSS